MGLPASAPGSDPPVPPWIPALRCAPAGMTEDMESHPPRHPGKPPTPSSRKASHPVIPESLPPRHPGKPQAYPGSTRSLAQTRTIGSTPASLDPGSALRSGRDDGGYGKPPTVIPESRRLIRDPHGASHRPEQSDPPQPPWIPALRCAPAGMTEDMESPPPSSRKAAGLSGIHTEPRTDPNNRIHPSLPGSRLCAALRPG
jgi:hypothetical protein